MKIVPVTPLPDQLIAETIQPRLMKHAIMVSEEISVLETLDMMRNYGISTVPVHKNQFHGKLLGFISLLDIVHWLTLSSEEDRINQSIGTVLRHIPVDRRAIVRLSSEDDKLVTLAHVLSLNHQCMIDDDQIATQTDLIQFALDNFEELFHEHGGVGGAHHHILRVFDLLMAESPVPLLRSPHGKVVLTVDSVHALTAFKKMAAHQCHQLAVVDSATGSIVSEIRASDIKLALKMESILDQQDVFRQFRLPVLSFLYRVYGGTVPDPIVGHLHTPLRDVMQKMLQFQVHHLWICAGGGDTQFPIAVITMTDLAQIIYAKLVAYQYPVHY